MKYILLLSTILLTGCSTVVPVTQKFPEVPEILMAKCDPLTTFEKKTVYLSEFMGVVTKNYTKYHTCAELAEAWQDWYTTQKKISDSLNTD